MAYVSLSQDRTKVTGIFNMPQNEPVPQDYFGEIPDNDQRVIDFLNPPAIEPTEDKVRELESEVTISHLVDAIASLQKQAGIDDSFIIQQNEKIIEAKELIDQAALESKDKEINI